MTEKLGKATISADLLEKAGYHEYHSDDMEYGERRFQKKFKDHLGTKYFIQVKYNYFTQGREQLRFWDFSMQIDTDKGAVNIETVQWFNQDGIHSGRTIEETEAYFEWLWQQHGKPYYELSGSGNPSSKED